MSAEPQERILKFVSEEPEAAVETVASEERADVDAFDVAAQRLVDELETLRRAIDEAQTDVFDAEVRLAKVEKELAAERAANAELSRALEVARHNADVADKRFVEVAARLRDVEEERAEATKKNASLSSLAEALKSERDANARTAASRRLAVARRDEELIETRRQRDDFERIAREARRENWIWRVVGFIGGAACFGASWNF